MTAPTLVEEWAGLTGQPETSNAMWHALTHDTDPHHRVAWAVVESRLTRSRDLDHARHLVGILRDATRSAINAIRHGNAQAAIDVLDDALTRTDLDKIFTKEPT